MTLFSVSAWVGWYQLVGNIWAASSEFGTYHLREQRRFRRACASAQSRQNLHCSLIQAVSQEEPLDRKPDPRTAPLNAWACIVKICHDGMLKDTYSLDASRHLCRLQIRYSLKYVLVFSFTCSSAVLLFHLSSIRFSDLSSVRFSDLSSIRFSDLSSVRFSDLSSVRFSDLSSVRFSDLSSVRFSDLSSIRFSDLSSIRFSDLSSVRFSDLSSVRFIFHQI